MEQKIKNKTTIKTIVTKNP